jgi:hypothetical protein
MSAGGELTTRRRGRPQRLRDDPIAISARQISVDHRIGWLLATHRILDPEPVRRQCDTLCSLALERGLRVDRSRISRWEGGTTPAGPEAIGLYETMLGLPAGSLATVAEGLRRALGGGSPRLHRVEPPGPGPDHLLDGALGGEELTGAQWQELARSLTAYESLYLRQSDWDLITTRLVAELGRAAGSASVRRFEAAARLIRHPSAQRHVWRALGRYVTDPDAQVVLPVLRLLTEVDDAAASTLALRMVSEDADPRLRDAAASVAAVMLRRGRLPSTGLPSLEEYAAVTLRQPGALDRGLDAVDVAVQLPLPSFQRVLHRIADRWFQKQLARSRATGELVLPQQAAVFVAETAAAVQAEGSEPGHRPEPDLMLRRLLREALFHVHHPRRHHAALLLAASPYRRAVSRQLQEAASSPHSFLAARAWATLMRVGWSGRRDDLLLSATSEHRPSLRARALVNVGLDPLVLSSEEARALVESVPPTAGPSVRDGLLFALGMSGGAHLAELAAHESEDFRRAAQWWQAQGTAIHER